MTPEMEVFLQLYNRACYFEAHEVLEQAWLKSRSAFYQGLIILAAAFCKRDRGNARGTVNNLLKARQRLAVAAVEAPVQMGIVIPEIVAAIDLRLENMARAGWDAQGAPSGDGQIDPQRLALLVPDLPLKAD